MTLAQKVFFLIALKHRPDAVSELFPYIPEAQKEYMQKLYDQLKDSDVKSIKAVATSELRKFSKPSTRSFLGDVHNDWLLEILLNESPEIIALVLRHLPAERVKAILDALPPEILSEMPKLSDTYAVPSALVDHLKQQFENFFTIDEILEPGEEVRFEHFSLLSTTQLDTVFLDIGYREIALGLVSLPEDTRHIVIDRLSVSDRKNVQKYLDLNEKDKVSNQRIKRAQVHLVSKEIDAYHSSLFIKELGFLFYAKSVLKNDLPGFEIIKKKMSKKEANVLKQLIDNHIEKNTEALVVAYREDVMSVVKKVLGA